MGDVPGSPVLLALSAAGGSAPVPLLTAAHRAAKAARARAMDPKETVEEGPTTPTKRRRAPQSSPSTSTKPPRKDYEGPEPRLKGVPPMIVGETWTDWANTPTAADMPRPSPLVLRYAEKPRISQRQLDRKMEAARVEILRRKAAAAVAALQAAIVPELPKKKSRSGPSGYTREWNKAKKEKELLEKAWEDNSDKTSKEREKKAEVESDGERDSFETES